MFFDIFSDFRGIFFLWLERHQVILLWYTNTMDEIIRKRIQFYGAVQGVGFRYRAKYAAQNVGATGWVRNEYDGSVTMEIQGTEAQIDQVILAAEKRSYVHIMDMKVKSLPVVDDEYGFRAM